MPNSAMSKSSDQEQPFVVSIHEAEQPKGTLVFTFVPKGLPQEKIANGVPRRVPQYTVAARQNGSKIVFDWSGSPDDPEGDAKEELEREVEERMIRRSAWITRVQDLMDQVEKWAKEMDWSTRRVEKKLDDYRIGKHRVPALLMQADTCRILLEPLGPSAMGIDGLVDLYLMPAYDDVVRLFHSENENHWNVHYDFPNSPVGAAFGKPGPKVFTRDVLEKILAEMKQHAA